MIDIPLLQELREIRHRLSVACQKDVNGYAKMLQEGKRQLPGTYVTKPLLPAAPARSEFMGLPAEDEFLA